MRIRAFCDGVFVAAFGGAIAPVLDEDIICPMGDEEHGFKYILAENFKCIRDGEIMGTVSPEVIEQMPRAN